MPFRTVEASEDLGAARPLVRRALEARAGPGVEIDSWLEHVEANRRAGRAGLRVLEEYGQPKAVVAWEPGGTLGARVDVLYAEAPFASVGTYAALLEELERSGRPVAFAPGRLAGISSADEHRLMTGRGFAPFGRSEMVYPDGRPPPELPDEPRGERRAIDPSDLTKLIDLHRRAYRGTFDRYLFLEEEDEALDAAREVREIVEGRWGALDPHGSCLLEIDGAPVASVLAVTGPGGTLLADVAVDPARQGQGWGRAVLTASLRSLLEHGARRIRLNVTEGNSAAVRLYERLGFVRSLGPTSDWYNARRIPVAPGQRG